MGEVAGFRNLAAAVLDLAITDCQAAHRKGRHDERDELFDFLSVETHWHEWLELEPAAFGSRVRAQVTKLLSEKDFIEAAAALGVSVAAIKAVAEVEAPKGGFLPDGRPTILYERHVFSRLTGRKYDKSHSDLSNEQPGGYKTGAAEWERLNRAIVLDAEAAHKSASWGKFQIMGFNHALAGYLDLKTFVLAMHTDERAQLDAFCNFLRSQKLVKFLLHRQWAEFAKRYNGKNYAKNSYDARLAAAFKKHSRAEAAAA
jgi:hypothetical protein